MARKSKGWMSTALWWCLASSAAGQVVPTGDPAAPPSATLQPTGTQVPTPTQAAHTRSEVLAYLLAIDDQGIALSGAGRDRELDPQVRQFAAAMFGEHRDNREATRRLAAELEVPSIETTDVRALRDVGGQELATLGRVSDTGFAAGWLDAVAEFDQSVIDLIDKRLLSDVDDDTRITAHLQAMRTRVAAQLLRASELRAKGK